MAISEMQARAGGYTHRIEWEHDSGHGGEALVKPDTDLDGEFRAYSLETGEVIRLRGWMLSVADLSA